MSSTISKKDNSLVEIAFEIPKEDFSEALKKAFQKNIKKFSIPGFRPGKAPMNIVTKYYGEGVLYDDAIEIIAEQSYVEAIKEHGLDPVSRPQIDEISEIGSDKGIKFTINVTVKPEVTLGDYKSIHVTKADAEITEKQIDEELDKVRERNARMIPVEDRAVLGGDTANIDYEGFLDGIPFEGGKGSSYDLRIGSNTFIPGFEEQVIGRTLAEEFDVDVTFPEDYHSEDLKGKAVVFKVKVNSIKFKELPAADDEFAKDVSEFDTLSEYRDSLRAKLLETATKNAELDYEESVVGQVVDISAVEIPDIMIENELDKMVDEQSSRMKYQGIELEQYLQYVGQDMKAFREGLKESASKRVKTNLVMEAIGKELAFEITDEDVEKEVSDIAEQYHMNTEDIKAQFAGNDFYFKESITFKKTLEFLKDQAAVGTTAKAASKTAAKTAAKTDAKEKAEPKAKKTAKKSEKA
ncbi:MAG: trigger factor [Saccharofermentanales bacterium]